MHYYKLKLNLLLAQLITTNMAFTEQEKNIIQYGMEQGKTRDEIQTALQNFRAGIVTTKEPVTAPVEERGVFQRIVEDIPSDIQETRERLGEAIDVGVERTAEIKAAQEAGEQGMLRSLLQRFGTGAGTVARGIGETITGVAKVAATPELEEATVRGIQRVAEPVVTSEAAQRALSMYEGLSPESKRDVDAVFGVLGLGAELFGAGVAGRGARQARLATRGAVEDIARRTREVEVPKIELPDAARLETIGVARDLIEDIVPKREQLREQFVANAFGLSPVTDLANIKKATGNDVGEFMMRNGLIRNTADETLQAVDDFHKANYSTVREAVALVDDTYTFNDLPEMESLIDFLIKDFDGRKSAEFVSNAARLREIKKAGTFQLSQAQEVKSMFDRVESIYKATGDVREAVAAQDKANVVRPIRRFIEARVDDNLGIDIRQINNNTQTTKEIMDAIAKRAGKQSTKSIVTLGDLSALGFGTVISPVVGVTALMGKKVLESSPFQLRMAQIVGGDVLEGVTPSELKKINDMIRDELKKSVDEVEVPKGKGAEAPKTRDTAGLVEEAKKYGTVDDFIVAQGKPLYHGTTQDFTEFSLDKAGSNTGAVDTKLGIFFIDDKNEAIDFVKMTNSDKTPRIVEAYVDLSRPVDLTTDGIFKNKEQAIDLYEFMFGQRVASSDEALRLLNENLGIGEMIEFEEVYNDRFVDFFKNRGYDGVLSTYGYKNNKEIVETVVFDPNQIKTRSQLENIWKQAHQ